MPISHIYWFAYFSLEEPSVRYRGLYALQQIERKHGISYTIIYPGYSTGNILLFIKYYFLILFARRKGSLIVYEKLHTQRVYGTALKLLLWARPQRTIYDIDDADYLKFSPQNIYYFMRNCEKCTVGSNTLLAHTSQYNKNVFLLTSPIIEHNQNKEDRNEHFTIGWIGYYNAHRQSLMELFFPALKEVCFPVKLILLGVTHQHHIEEVRTYFSSCSNVTVEMPVDIDWLDEPAIYRRIAAFDIGVAPLLDTELNKAKSAFKTKQYLSCGVPVLGSAVGENASILQHGVNGFACENAADYVSYIHHIRNLDSEQYRALSYNAKKSSAAFNMDAYCDTLVSIAAEDKVTEAALTPQL